MLAISAADAISPAIQRTRTFLFRPFRLATFLKLCLVACVTEGIGGNFQFGGTGGPASHHHSNFYPPPTLTAGWIAVVVVIAVAAMALGCVLYYLVTRLRFAYFHCVIHNTKEIRPGWRLYSAQAKRFFWLNVAVGFSFLLAAALIFLPFIAGFWKLVRNTHAGAHPALASILILLLPLIPILFLLVLAAISADIILRDLMLPHFALENASAGSAWSAVWTRIKAEKGSFVLYAFLRILLPMAALVGLFIVLIIPGILFLVAVIGADVGLHAVFSNASSAAAAIGVLLEVLIGVVAFAIALSVGIAVGGPVGTAIRQYALLFYGSRYEPLANLLWPPATIGPSAPEIA
ncbi:MAG TPA: hypothetical protein VF018_17535 [Acidobacteriaceae bacterium]